LEWFVFACYFNHQLIHQLLCPKSAPTGKFIGKSLRIGFRTSAWHLQIIGILDKYRSQGIDTALSKEVLEKALLEFVPLLICPSDILYGNDL
jgi:hypothetical protein